MTSEEFKTWRKGLKISQQRAGDLLGYGKTMIYYFENDKQEIPIAVDLGCYAITNGFYEQKQTKTPTF